MSVLNHRKGGFTMRAELTVAACLTFGSSGWGQETIRPADYLPLIVGIEREYEDENMGNRTEKVTGVEPGTGLFMLENPSPWEDGSVHYWSRDSEGMKLHKGFSPSSSMWAFYDPPITKFPHTMELNVRYVDTSSIFAVGMVADVQSSATFEGIEDHVVGETTYPLCAKVTTSEVASSANPQYTSVMETTEWWARGIGPVEKQFHQVLDYWWGHQEIRINSKLVRFFAVSLQSISCTITGEVQITWQSIADVKYTVFYTEVLAPLTTWTQLSTSTGTGNLMEWLDDGTETGTSPMDSAVLRRFYALRGEP
jgi:hypothetical protein